MEEVEKMSKNNSCAGIRILESGGEEKEEDFWTEWRRSTEDNSLKAYEWTWIRENAEVNMENWTSFSEVEEAKNKKVRFGNSTYTEQCQIAIIV